MSPRPPADCPVCGFALTVTRVSCEVCGTELTGRFTPCGLCRLPAEDVAIVHALLATGGDVAGAARRTGVGVDRLRARLLAAAERLGIDHVDHEHPDAAEAPALEAPDASDDSDDFLQRLAHGVVEADDALRHLP